MSQEAILEALKNGDSKSGRELARELGISRESVSKQLTKLVEIGELARVPDPEDYRVPVYYRIER